MKKTVILTIQQTKRIRVEVGDDDDDYEYEGTNLLAVSVKN